FAIRALLYMNSQIPQHTRRYRRNTDRRTYTENEENLHFRLKLRGRKTDTCHWVMEAPSKPVKEIQGDSSKLEYVPD
ncbi:hypothetical protein AVEN_195912-1, partial [Araneus ventricosus]